MKRNIVFCAALIVCGITASDDARAQPLPFYPGMRAELPPHEIALIVRSAGLDPSSRPVSQGGAYWLRARDRTGQEVRVVVDARRGRILRVVRIAPPSYAAMPPRYGRPPGIIPGGDDPEDTPGAVGPPAVDAPPVNARGSAGVPIEPGRGAAASSSAAPSGAPPLPRSRPRLAATHAPAAAASETAAPATPPAGRGVHDASETRGTIATSANPAWQE